MDKKHLDISQNILFYDPQRKQSHPRTISDMEKLTDNFREVDI